ncbi:hypothetical protein M9Y10_008222 [Tritrichomonas musculus]|uniref:BEACH domain-containing protein n=1 Tax=Tritrichomonas musculus TaxID=1915356 RepID=A0ABR2IYG2_9EUKA
MSNSQHTATSNNKTTVNMQTIYSVLEMKASITQDDLKILSELESDLYNQLPQVDKMKIDKLKRDLQIYPLEQALSHFPIDFNQFCLFKSVEEIVKNNENIKQLPKPLVVFIFFHLISLLYFKVQNEIDVGLMKSFIKALIKCPTSNQPLAAIFFQNLIDFILESQKSYLNKEFFQIAFDFIRTNSSINGAFYESFTNLCKDAFNLKEEELNSYVINIVFLLFTEKRSFIKRDDQSLLLKALDPFIKEDNPQIFNLLSTISMASKCQALKKIYSDFGEKIINKIADYPIKVSHQNECDKLPAVEISNRDQYSFVGTESHTFPNGFKPLPQQFYDNYDISQHFPNEIWNFCIEISDLLKKSSIEATDTFFSQMMSMYQEEKNSDLFYTHLSILLLLLQQNATPSRLLFSKVYLISEKVFNPNNVIFNEGGLDPIINYLRNEIVQILADKDPHILMEIMTKKNVYLFVEFLGRLLSISSKLDNFSTFKTFFADIIDVSTYLQAADLQHHNEKLSTIRSVIFSFTARLAKFSVFLEPEFARSFTHFIFESDITDQILLIFKLNFSLCKSGNKYLPLIERFSTILHICASRSVSNERYSILAFKITDMINSSLKHSKQTIELAYQLFDVIFQCFKVKPTSDFLLLVLSLLRIISSWKEDFTLNVEKIMFISTFIKNNELFEKVWFLNILTLITNSYVPPQSENALNQFYFIERPQFILFFLSCFGISPQFPQYLKVLSLNSQISPYNSRNCHDGCLDIVLLQFLAEGKEECNVTHRGISINLKIPTQAQKDYVFPLLISMFSSKTSYSVVSLLHKLCRMNDVNFLTLFESALAACTLRHSPYYLISSLPVINSSELSINSSKFSLTFWFKLDVQRIMRTRPAITFFSLSDKKSTLTLSFNINKFYLTYEIPKEKPSRIVYQFFLIDRTKSVSESIVAANFWHFLSISFATIDGKQSVWFSIDDIPLKLERQITKEYVTNLHPINFSKGKIELNIGQIKTNDPQRCRELGYIAEFCYYPRVLQSSESHEFCLQQPHDEQDFVEIVSKSSYFRSKTLLEIYDDYFVLQQFINALSIVLKPDFLYSLKYILPSISQQLNLSMTDDVLDCVIKMQPHDSSLYLTVYSIFEVLSDEHLEEEWIRTLIFNLSLWMKSDHISKYIILCHWTSTLLQNYAQIFKSMSKFSEVLRYFETTFKNDEDDCKYEYIKLLSKLAFLNFSNEDSNNLFAIAISSWSKPSFKFYLKLIRNIAGIIAPDQQKKMILYLHNIIQNPSFIFAHSNNENSNEIVHELLMTLHDLASLLNNVNESIVLMRLIPHTKINNDALFYDILNNLNDFPGFYPLLCGLSAISTQSEKDEQIIKDDREKIANKMIEIQKSLFPPVRQGTPTLANQKTVASTKPMNTISSPSVATAAKPQSLSQVKVINKVPLQPPTKTPVKQQQQKQQQSVSPSPKQGTSIKKFFSSPVDAAEVADKGYKLKMMYNELWYFWPIILSFKMNGYSNEKIFNFLANGTAELGNQNEKILTIQNICSLLTYISAGLQVQNLASKYLIALHDLINSNENLVLSEIVNQLVFISFYHISPHTHNSLFIKEFTKSPYHNENSHINYLIGSIFPMIKLNTISDIDDFANDRKVPSIGFEHLFDDKENFVAFPTLQIAMKVLTETRIRSDYAEIINYFAQKKRNGSCNKNPSLFDKMRTNYSDQFANVTVKLFANMSKCLRESKTAISGIDKLSYKQIDVDSKSLIAELKELQPKPELTNMLDFCRSRVLTPDFPPKIKKRLFTRPIKKNNHFQLKKADLTISNASLVNIKKSRHCEFQISKEFIKVIVDDADKLFRLRDIQVVYLFDTNLEFHTYIGRSYLIDLSRTSQNATLLSKYFSDYQVAKPDPSKWTSNFEYLIHLNNISGRSFNKTRQYPIFPNVLVNFSDYMCRNIASLRPDSIKINQPDINFLRWNGSFYNVVDFRLSRVIENESFFPPEFYYFPELFGDCQLPPWASTKFEFVYKMRKLLESQSVTNNLPKWIDMIWYDKEYVSTKHDHKVIFHLPHKSKDACVPPPPKLKENHDVEIMKNSNVVFSLCNKKTIGIITNDREIQFFLIVHENSQLTFKKIKNYQLDLDVSKYVFFATNDLINAFNKDTMNLTRYASNNIIDDKTIYCETPEFKEFDRSFVYSEDFSTIRSEYGHPYRSDKEIICFAASARFGFIAFATVDNVIHIQNTPKGKGDISRKLTSIPLKLLITKSWGFIVVQTQGEITILNQNGELIKTIKFEYDMNYWTTFSSVSGFDYIMFRYRINALCMFEAMYPEHVTFICEANDMVGVHYSQDFESLLIVNKLGKVTVKPIALSSMFK